MNRWELVGMKATDDGPWVLQSEVELALVEARRQGFIAAMNAARVTGQSADMLLTEYEGECGP